MKKTGILIGLIIIVISASASYLLLNKENKTERIPSKSLNDISDKGKTEKPESSNLAPPVKEHRTSPVSENSSNIPDLKNKPEPVRTLLDPGKDDTERNEASNLLRAAGYKGLTDDLIASLREEILNPKL